VRVKVSDLSAYLGTDMSAPTAASGATEPTGTANIGDFDPSLGSSAPTVATGRVPAKAVRATAPRLKPSQTTKLDAAIETLLGISAALVPGSFLQRELAECAGRLQAAVRVEAASE
jgi:hypothetical protein